MIGDIGGKIGVGSVRLHERPVGVVAESRRSEQGLLAILPILQGLPFRRRKTSFIDETAPAQLGDRRGDQISLGPTGQRALREKNLVFDVQASEIGPDHRHHRVDRGGAHLVKPFGFRPP